MQFEHNRSLRSGNTLGFDRSARYYCEPATPDQLQEALAFAASKQLNLNVLGSGSNIILTRNIDGLVVHPSSKAITHTPHAIDTDHVRVTCDAGVNWNDLVQFTLNHGLYGLENLSLIPGLAGAAPIQNIGAYGVELCDVFESLSAVHIASGDTRIFHAEDCAFGYRDSVFKSVVAGEYIITQLTLNLTTTGPVNLSYGALAQAVEESDIEHPTAQDVSNIVCAIRRAKLPDPSKIGNAGSFFKNPIIRADTYALLKKDWPTLPGHQVSPTDVQAQTVAQHENNNYPHMKVPAAWLIDQSGYKGQRYGNVGVHHLQALVLVHFGGGTGDELLALASRIQTTVKNTFGIMLEIEPGIV